MVSKHIQNWAQRFVFGNDSDFIQKHIKLLAESGNSQTLLTAIEQAVEILNRETSLKCLSFNVLSSLLIEFFAERQSNGPRNCPETS